MKNNSKIVLITGASSGIGKATAYCLAKNNYNLIICGRRKDKLKTIKRDLTSRYNCKVKVLSFDITDFHKCQSAINGLSKKWQNISILINNAGLASGLDPIQSGKISNWESMLNTNVKGLLYMSRIISPKMVEKQCGHIINICSTAGHEVYPKGNVYCASKHAVNALTKAMRIDLLESNVKVSQVSPAHVENTEFAKVRFHGDVEKAKIYEDFTPLNAEDIATTLLFIISRPLHVNILDIVLAGTQQANSIFINRSGRNKTITF